MPTAYAQGLINLGVFPVVSKIVGLLRLFSFLLYSLFYFIFRNRSVLSEEAFLLETSMVWLQSAFADYSLIVAACYEPESPVFGQV